VHLKKCSNQNFISSNTYLAHQVSNSIFSCLQLMEIGRDGEGGDDALQHVMAGKRDAIEPVPIPLRPMAEKIALVTKWK